MLASNAPSVLAVCTSERLPAYNHSHPQGATASEQTLQAIGGGSKRGIKLLRENDEVCVSEVVENSEIQISPTTHKIVRLSRYYYV